MTLKFHVMFRFWRNFKKCTSYQVEVNTVNSSSKHMYHLLSQPTALFRIYELHVILTGTGRQTWVGNENKINGKQKLRHTGRKCETGVCLVFCLPYIGPTSFKSLTQV
jgi:hypothetical protein